jgi:Fic family protein
MMLDPRVVDAAYRSFPPFSEWAAAHVDHARWNRYSARLEERGKSSPEQLALAQDVVKRAAAVDTGAIEGLYEVDRGFTFTVATQAAIWEAAVDAKGPRVRALIESQLRAYDHVLDLATGNQPVSEVWIRSLHAELCEPQKTYTVITEVGPQVQELPLGKYKHLPNHVLLAEGATHAYAPADLVPAEMHRLCEILRSDEFASAHPVLQASYAHYALVLIHPFADGNGRVARALASVFTYRSHSIPLMVLVENRKDYLESLAAADAGNYQAFVDFTMERALDSILLVDESLGAALSPRPADALGELDALFTTSGGYSQEQVDDAGRVLLEQIRAEFDAAVSRFEQGERVRIAVSRSNQYGRGALTLPGVRPVLATGWDRLSLNLATGAPVQADVHATFMVTVPLDAGRDDDVTMVDLETQRRVFSARLSELLPEPTAALKMRISIGVQRILGDALNRLVAAARSKAQSSRAPNGSAPS